MQIKSFAAAAVAITFAASMSAQGIQPPGQGGGGGNNRNAGQAQVKVGSKAGEVRVQEWIKLPPFQGEALQEGKPYVIDFFLTSSGESLKAIPMLTDLAAKYPQMQFIGISNEDADTLNDFVDRMGDRMDYAVGQDFRGRSSRWWLAGSGHSAPTTYLINDDLTIAWIGRPTDEEFPRILGLVADGRFDPLLREAAEPFLVQAEHAVRVREWRTAINYFDEVLKMDAHVFNDVAIRKFEVLLMAKKDVEAALEYARSTNRGEQGFLGLYESDAYTVRRLANDILSTKEWMDQTPEGELTTLALELAEKAYRASPDARSLSTLALANYHTGNVDTAISLQRKAYLMADVDEKEQMKRLFDQFHQGAEMSRAGGN